MDTFDAIYSRRSIRKYESKAVEPEKIQKLLTAAMYAPSARNTQSWQYIVITERSVLKTIMDVHPYAQMLAEAPLAIIVCGDKTMEPNEGYLNTNCSAATQNILLAAQASGLGSVWLGVYPRQERMKGIAGLFMLPEHIIPISLIALGYPAEKKMDPGRYMPERVHYNKW
ncbi:MAG: nitroreductase family protein [Bacteroidales bacterium]|jgi:nitroreductase